MVSVSSFSLLVVGLTLPLVDAYAKYATVLPNGDAVPGVAAVGHTNVKGGGDANQFGLDFSSAGSTWSAVLCQLDSDGDGATNGEELGDPCCKWTKGAKPFSSTATSPGHKNDFTASQLAALKCPSSPTSNPTTTPSPTSADPVPSPTSSSPNPSPSSRSPKPTSTSDPTRAPTDEPTDAPVPTPIPSNSTNPPTDCVKVSVQGDATYCIAGPICVGAGEVPAGKNCPSKGAVAGEDCVPGIPSYANGLCALASDATCSKLSSGAWGCTLSNNPNPSNSSSTVKMATAASIDNSSSNTTFIYAAAIVGCVVGVLVVALAAMIFKKSRQNKANAKELPVPRHTTETPKMANPLPREPWCDGKGVCSEQDITWAKKVVDDHARMYNHECLVCHSKQTVLLPSREHVYCRMCRTKTANVYYQPPPNDKLRELERLLKEDATEMLTNILQAFEFDHNKTRLSEVKAIAQGQLLKVAKFYIPIAVDIVGAVVAQYGFTGDLEGVMKSIRALQEHVGDDIFFLEGLERLRILFSPFNAFELEDAKIRQEEVDAQNEIKRQEEMRALESKKQEDIAQERRNAALKRAKKVARGLNPNELYLPVIARQPPSNIVLLPGRRAFISIVADRTESFQWYFNDAKLSEDTPGLHGTKSSFLKIYYFTKSMCGVYKCKCTNDDGTMESSSCTITMAVLKSTLRRRVNCGGVPHAITLTSNTNALTIMTTKSLQVYSSLTLQLHPIVNPMVHTEQLLALASHKDQVLVGLSSGCTFVCRSTIQASAPIKPAPKGGPASRRNSIISNPDAKASARRLSTSTTTMEYMQKSQSTLRAIRSITFMCNNSWLILSDLMHTIQLYNIANSSELPLLLATFVITAPNKQRILHIAASPSLLYFAVTYEHTRRVDLYHISSILYSKKSIPTTCKVSAMAFPKFGYQLALGEHGVMHGYLHILNLETKARNVYLKAHFGPIQHMEYMSNLVLCTLGMDQIIKVWDTSKKACLIEFNSYAAVASSLLVYGCNIVVGYYSKQVELYEIESLHKVLESIDIEHHYAIVLMQKHWRGSLARYRLKKSTEDNQESTY